MNDIHIHIPGIVAENKLPASSRTSKRTIIDGQSLRSDYKSWVKHCASEVMKRTGARTIPQEVALHLIMDVIIARPTLVPEKVLCPVTKPNLDNIQKTVLGALEGIAYQTEHQIVSIRSVKRYGITDCVYLTLANWSDV